MKKVYKYILLLLIAIVLFGCGKGQSNIVRMSVNPSVEFVFNAKGKVEAVTPYNEDGSIVINGEDFTGLDEEEATEKFIEICVELGYIDEDGSQTLTISVSGDSSYANKLKGKIEKAASDCLNELNINDVTIELNEILSTELDSILTSMCYSEAEIGQMSDSEKVETILNERVKTQILPTLELVNLYYSTLDVRIELSKYEALEYAAKSLDQLSAALYSVATKTYFAIVNEYINYTNVLFEMFNTYFVSEDSNYQKALSAKIEAKAALQLKKEELNNLDPNSQEYLDLQLEIQLKEDALSLAIEELEKAKEYAQGMLDTVQSLLDYAKDSFEQAFESVLNVMKSFINREELNLAIEERIGMLKDTYVQTFFKNHKDEIVKIEVSVSTQKGDLKE